MESYIVFKLKYINACSALKPFLKLIIKLATLICICVIFLTNDGNVPGHFLTCLPCGVCAKALDDERKGDFNNLVAGSGPLNCN